MRVFEPQRFERQRVEQQRGSRPTQGPFEGGPHSVTTGERQRPEGQTPHRKKPSRGAGMLPLELPNVELSSNVNEALIFPL